MSTPTSPLEQLMAGSPPASTSTPGTSPLEQLMSTSAPPASTAPVPPKEGSYLKHALSPTDAVAGPGEASFVAANPDEQGKLLGAAAVGVSGPTAIAAMSAIAPHLDTIVKVAKILGYGSLSVDQAVSLYKKINK